MHVWDCLRYVRRPESLQRLCIWQHYTAWISRKRTIRRCPTTRVTDFLSLSRRYFVDVFCIARCLEGCSKMFKVPFQISKYVHTVFLTLLDSEFWYVLIDSANLHQASRLTRLTPIWALCDWGPSTEISPTESTLWDGQVRLRAGRVEAIASKLFPSAWNWNDLGWAPQVTESRPCTLHHVASRCQVRHGKTW